MLEAFNIFDAEGRYDYFYASRLPGEPLDGIEGHPHASGAPRSARFGIRFLLGPWS